MNKKIISILLAAGMISSASTFAFAEEPSHTDAPIETVIQGDVMLISENGEAEVPAVPVVTPSYISDDVTVVSINDGIIETVLVGKDKNNQENIINYKILESTAVFVKGEKKTTEDIKVGDTITVYTDANSPAPLIMPPQYQADVIIVKGEEMTDVDVYSKNEEYYVNNANTLALKLDDKTEIVDVDGNKTDDIDGKRLVVFYANSTRSIPAQTTPSKVVVLAEEKASNTKTETFFSGEEKNSYVSADNELVINVSEDTEIVDKEGNKYTESLDGMILTVTYENTTRSIPAQTTPTKVVVEVKSDAVKANVISDTFFKNGEASYINADNSFIINISETTSVVDKNGIAYTESLDNKELTVTYENTTKSIPAQTTPSKVVVNGEGTKEHAPMASEDIEIVQVGDSKDKVEKSENGVNLYPIRWVCEALNLKVEWNNDTREVNIDNKLILNVDKDVFADAEDESKSAAVEIIKDKTYAPSGIFAKLGLKTEHSGNTVVISK